MLPDKSPDIAYVARGELTDHLKLSLITYECPELANNLHAAGQECH